MPQAATRASLIGGLGFLFGHAVESGRRARCQPSTAPDGEAAGRAARRMLAGHTKAGPGKAIMDLEIDADARTATLSINGTYDADELLALMGKLAQARAQLCGEFDKATGTPVQLCAGPVDAGPAAGGMRLAIRHPDLGWVLTHVAIAQIAKLLAIGASVLATELGVRDGRAETAKVPVQ